MNPKKAAMTLLVILILGMTGIVHAQQNKVQAVSAQTLKAWMDQLETVYIVDLRSPLECLDAKIPQAVCSFDESNVLVDAPKSSKMIFYAGNRPVDQASPLIQKVLSGGWENIYVLQGGLTVWRKEGYPVLSEDRMPRVFAFALDVRDFNRWQKQARHPLVLDIRESVSYAGGHIEGAVNFPLSQLHVDYAKIPLTTDLLVVDEDGAQSYLVASFLVRKGFQSPQRLKGGMAEYRRSIK